MKLSPAFKIFVSDVLNTFKHSFYVFISSVLITLQNSLQNGQPIDWNMIKIGSLIALVNGLIVLVDRYLKDNTGGNVGSD